MKETVKSRELCVEWPDADQLGGYVHVGGDCIHCLPRLSAEHEVLRLNLRTRLRDQCTSYSRLDGRAQDQTEKFISGALTDPEGA